MSSNHYGNGDMANEVSARSAGLSNGYSGYSNGAGNGALDAGSNLHRQSSRRFDQQQPRGYPSSPMYADDDRLPSYETRTLDRSSIAQNQSYGQQQQYSGGFDPSPGPWGNPSPQAQYSSATVGANSRIRPGQGSRRAPLPPQWGAEPAAMSQFGMQHTPPMQQINSYSTGGASNGMSNGHAPTQHGQSYDDEDLEELIPTAIVIKNIPFAVKREQLAALMNELQLPAPYAFNYHFDAGVFRGLAFANFQNPQDTAQVINTMNHMDLQGRKLRVEYKKMLPQQERERIEREKRLRRGQLEEQHRPIEQQRSLNMQPSYSSLSSAHHLPPSQSTSPSPVSLRGPMPLPSMDPGVIDFNDPWTLDMYTEIAVFKRDTEKEMHIFPNALTDKERRIVHEIAHNAGIHHTSIVYGSDPNQKTIQLSKTDPKQLMMPPGQYGSNGINYNNTLGDRRALSRAATTDFTEPRDAGHNSLRTQTSAYLNPMGEGLFNTQSLRGAKSFSDLQNRIPSPANSQGFPSDLANNASRYASMYTSGNSSASNLLPSRTVRDDLSTSFNSMSLGGGLSSANASRLDNNARLGAVGSTAGAIGSHRSNNGLNGTHEDVPQQQSRANALRQPRGPTDWTGPSGFTRNRQRGSNDLDAESTDSLDSPVSNSHPSGRFASSRN